MKLCFNKNFFMMFLGLSAAVSGEHISTCSPALSGHAEGKKKNSLHSHAASVQMIEASFCLLLLIWSDPRVFVCVFQRLSTANDEIVEVLLSKQQVLGALRFIRSVGAHDNVSARKFLDAARQTNDTMLFYTIFRFFEQRNMRLRGNPGFNQGK